MLWCLRLVMSMQTERLYLVRESIILHWTIKSLKNNRIINNFEINPYILWEYVYRGNEEDIKIIKLVLN